MPSGTPVIEEHGLGVCPVVRFLHDLDLDGEMDVSGEVEPLIPLQDQINTTTFNTLMAQQYAAFRQRWVTGMVPMDEDNRPREPFRVRGRPAVRRGGRTTLSSGSSMPPIWSRSSTPARRRSGTCPRGPGAARIT